MLKPDVLLEKVLNEVEKRIKENINADLLADNLGLSSINRHAFGNFLFSPCNSRRVVL
jgi:hypothetical protein